ncbi:MAG: hypothetical protein HYR56_22805 [Acidobacteria bacterium]|nr:hypothetical protein [Acidobacteriota bacterium]MBI3424380.1 hypothetical protein [Acidobacteriota bacterium]
MSTLVKRRTAALGNAIVIARHGSFIYQSGKAVRFAVNGVAIPATHNSPGQYTEVAVWLEVI